MFSLQINTLKCSTPVTGMKTNHTIVCYRYYSGEKKAPVLTVVIGGNHEASSHLQELSYGGWLAPNIYYLGTSCLSLHSLFL